MPARLSQIAPAMLRRRDLEGSLQGRVTMTNTTGVEVTLSSELLRHLRAEAKKLGVAIEWLIASMVVDTAETIDGRSDVPITA
jgi:hypothetical protein